MQLLFFKRGLELSVPFAADALNGGSAAAAVVGKDAHLGHINAADEGWAPYSLLDHGDILLHQNIGSWAFCIADLLKKGYDKDMVLMSSNASSDLDAARANGIYYYPTWHIMREHPWKKFQNATVDRLTGGVYGEAYQQEKLDAFLDNLKS